MSSFGNLTKVLPRIDLKWKIGFNCWWWNYVPAAEDATVINNHRITALRKPQGKQ